MAENPAPPAHEADDVPHAAKPRIEAGPQITIRHYCQGIGDCHLLRFPKEGGGDFFMLIDCGVHTSVSDGAEKMRAIVANIFDVTKGRIDVLVVTHEHADHVSGFLSAAEQFKNFTVHDVWFAWTENPKDEEAQKLDTFRQKALKALQMAGAALAEPGLGPHLQELGRGVGSVIDFSFGVKGERVRAGRDAAREMAARKPTFRAPTYLEPGSDPFPLPDVAGVRVYVLGPPREIAMIRVEEQASEMYGHGFGAAVATSLMAAMGGSSRDTDETQPFDADLGQDIATVMPLAEAARRGKHESSLVTLLRDHYAGPVPRSKAQRSGSDDPPDDQSWRRIDGDWLGAAADLALQLDKGINNTSLVLAFELEPDGRVVLFPGDAQVGSWLTWGALTFGQGPDAKTGADLLRRTVYLKVAHHGSHNATLKQKGIERMNEPDLSAFIPVNRADAIKVGWKRMPFGPILDALAQRTNGRVICADDPWIAKGAVPQRFQQSDGAIKRMRLDPESAGLWIEVDVA